MICATLSRSRKAVAAAETDSDYFATKTHYLSLANRIVASLRGGGSFVLIAGDPPAVPHLLSQALRQATPSRYTVIDIPCRADLISEPMSRARSVVAALLPSGGPTAELQPSEATPRIFVFADSDRFSDRQIREICNAIEHSSQKGTAALLLAHSGFLARLEEGPLQFLKERLVAWFEFRDVGQDEGIAFIRHRLAAGRARSGWSGIPAGVLRGLAASGVLLSVGIGVYMFLHHHDLAGERLGRSNVGIESPHEMVGSRPTPSETRVNEPGPIPGDMSLTAATAPAPLAQETLSRNGLAPTAMSATSPAAVPDENGAGWVPEMTLPAVSPYPELKQAAPLHPTSNPPAPSLANQDFPTEIAALVNRGDDFLSAGDITSARLFYLRAADAGNAPAALRLGATFDPNFLRRAGIRGVFVDAAQAASWYRRARDLGESAAAAWLKDLGQRRAGEPSSLPR
jgi:hypothetical protein